MANSLRAQLLAWVLGPLALLAAFNATASWFSARATADLVTDRTLLASARSIAEQIHIEDGLVQVVVPPAALEMFDTGEGDFFYYAATGMDGQLLAGVSGLPTINKATADNGAAIEAVYHGRRLRLLALDHPLAGPGLAGGVTVVVGVSLLSRDALMRHLWLVGCGQQLALIVAVGLLMAFGLKRELAPLLRMRDAVLGRPSASLEPLDPSALQAELQPLVMAINQQMARVQKQLAAQHRFVSNAAHQLRTPLTLLNVQATYALRHRGTTEINDVLEAIRASTQQLSRLAGQLLTLSRAEPGSRRPRADTIDLGRLATRVLESFAEPALAKEIDLGLDVSRPSFATGDATMLGEALTNLVDNAVRYCPAGSMITVAIRLGGNIAVLSVQDNGPGVPLDQLERLFERFYRVPGVTSEGSGLGLAIVKEVAEAASGSVSARVVSGGGLSVEIRLPAAAEPAPCLDPGDRPDATANDPSRRGLAPPCGPKAD